MVHGRPACVDMPPFTNSGGNCEPKNEADQKCGENSVASSVAEKEDQQAKERRAYQRRKMKSMTTHSFLPYFCFE